MGFTETRTVPIPQSIVPELIEKTIGVYEADLKANLSSTFFPANWKKYKYAPKKYIWQWFSCINTFFNICFFCYCNSSRKLQNSGSGEEGGVSLRGFLRQEAEGKRHRDVLERPRRETPSSSPRFDSSKCKQIIQLSNVYKEN